MGQVSKPDVRAGARDLSPAVPVATGSETCPTSRSSGPVGNPKENRLKRAAMVKVHFEPPTQPSPTRGEGS